VQELEVVTGTGDIVQCSMSANRDLFEAMLGGIGQCGIITRVKMDVVRTKPMVRIYRIHYTDNSRFFKDFRTLLNRGEFDGVYNLWLPNDSALLYELNAFAYFDPAHPPDGHHLLRGLSVEESLAVAIDLPYVTATQFIDDIFIDPMRTALDWDQFIKPTFNVWLPDDTVEEFVGDVISNLTLEDVGLGGFVLLLPQHRSKMTRPFCRVPNPHKSDFVYLFDLLNTASLPGQDLGYIERMLSRNRRLFDKARAAGGTRYPISAIEFTAEDWRIQYGDSWPRFAALKQRFDPDKILTPGPGVFS
jgi:FAD/FMN-containing dehydrogenase